MSIIISKICHLLWDWPIDDTEYTTLTINNVSSYPMYILAIPYSNSQELDYNNSDRINIAPHEIGEYYYAQDSHILYWVDLGTIMFLFKAIDMFYEWGDFIDDDTDTDINVVDYKQMTMANKCLAYLLRKWNTIPFKLLAVCLSILVNSY